jgi:hypothetical protein
MMRLSNLHEVLMLVFNNRLVPPELSRPRKILDLGSGTGDWAVEVAKTFPACEEGFPVVSGSRSLAAVSLCQPLFFGCVKLN